MTTLRLSVEFADGRLVMAVVRHNNRDSEEVGMERATPVELRRSMEAADAMKDSGLRFVPMPVIDEEDHRNLVLQMYEKLAKIAELCDDE